MIISYKHKGLKELAEKDKTAKLPQVQIPKIRLMLSRLDVATTPEIMREPGYRLHELEGNRKGTFSIMVTGNYRITFCFEGENVADVDYEDYH